MGATHKAVAIPAPGQPLVIIDTPTVQPQAGEVLVRVQWTGSSPLDLHQAAGGLGVTEPNQRFGDTYAGIVAALGPDVTTLEVGDRVTGFAFEKPQHKAQQEYVTVPTYLVSPVPASIPLHAAATVGSSLVTVFHTVTADLGLDLPWPIPQGWAPPHADAPVLLWGGAGSVGTFALQVLRHWGYRNVLAVASARHHAYLRGLGAAATFDYAEGDVTDKILAHVGEKGAGPRIPFIFDCIGLLSATVEPLTRVAETGSRVAILLPVIVRDATETEASVFEGDVNKCHEGKWAPDVVLRGVRTHFYAQVSLVSISRSPGQNTADGR
ncbi:zinc-binding alcohol dehydrogenase family protein, partial [Candidatus Bathyarchaeota archaeon]|nr:zinc-binding alcohol dehydrogenase family protein [Candidatus Bathyarchaeota archaeon]